MAATMLYRNVVGAVFLVPQLPRPRSPLILGARNSIFADAGHCFKTPRAIAIFGTGCYPPYGRLKAAQEARVNAIIAEESRLGCSGSGPSGGDALLPPPDTHQPDTQQGDNSSDRQLNEEASAWGATKDTSSPAVLSLHPAFWRHTVGDLARARLEESEKDVGRRRTSAGEKRSHLA